MISLFGTGGETRDFIHISDFTLFMDIIIQKSNFNAEVFNAASGQQTDIKSISAIFEKHYAGAKKITFNGEVKKGDPIHWEADITAVRKLGFAPKADFEASVLDYVKWFSREYEI